MSETQTEAKTSNIRRKGRLKLKKHDSNKRERSISLQQFSPERAGIVRHRSCGDETASSSTGLGDSESSFSEENCDEIKKTPSEGEELEPTIVCPRNRGKKSYGCTDDHTCRKCGNSEVSEVVDSAEVETKCFICCESFSPVAPPVSIPCVKNCNNTPVHAKCIYEWRENSKSGTGGCPLCRSPLNKVSYFPRDVFCSSKLKHFKPRRYFLSHPIPRKAGVARCYIRAVRGIENLKSPTYELYLQRPTTLDYPLGPVPDNSAPRDGDILLAVAQKYYSQYAVQLSLCMADNMVEKCYSKTDLYLGAVSSSFSGLRHVFSTYHKFEGDETPSHCEIGAVTYTQNLSRSSVGPRRVKVCLPGIQRIAEYNKTAAQNRTNRAHGNSARSDSCHELFGEEENLIPLDYAEGQGEWATKVYQNLSRSDGLSKLLDKGLSRVTSNKAIFGKNKEPYWLESIQAYSLDFRGRVTLPSNKNFQLIIENAPEPTTGHNKLPIDPSGEEISLQFGKVGEERGCEIFTMDIRWPLSPLQAFAICLSACDRKLLAA
mmetsp:Transcript_6845/g.7863  ORF Transcript_6845/g.7863 Transcript_6845/m.7863 type:complete len:544 (-) Transcript_6845:247-1878(-)